MTKKMKQLIMALLVIVMSVSILAVPAAAETKEYTASIPVEIQIDPHYVPVNKDTFQIKVTPDSDTTVMPEGGKNGVYEIVGAGSMNLDFKLPGLGVYTYEISQVDRDPKDGCYEDDAIYDLKIYVINDNPENLSESNIVVNVVLKLRDGDDANKPNKALFVNKYAKPVEVPLSATKIYNGKTPKTKLFYFELKDSKGELLESVYNVGKDVIFTPRVYDKEGTYIYKISEEILSRPGVIFDKSIYTVTVEITRDIANEGDYKASVTYKKGDKACDAEDLVFINTSITGGNPITGDQFRMILWVSIMAISLIALVVVVIIWNKNRKK